MSFLLTEAERKHVRQRAYFNNMETLAVIKFKTPPPPPPTKGRKENTPFPTKTKGELAYNLPPPPKEIKQ